mmetsp:Transcript_2730/g.7504  ORF Transcript_2730/g.7504 Transcript_2730/m.7504 type:complete len:229 (+) Transcript_2730:1232-1918(+)
MPPSAPSCSRRRRRTPPARTSSCAPRRVPFFRSLPLLSPPPFRHRRRRWRFRRSAAASAAAAPLACGSTEACRRRGSTASGWPRWAFRRSPTGRPPERTPRARLRGSRTPCGGGPWRGSWTPSRSRAPCRCTTAGASASSPRTIRRGGSSRSAASATFGEGAGRREGRSNRAPRIPASASATSGIRRLGRNRGRSRRGPPSGPSRRAPKGTAITAGAGCRPGSSPAGG